MMLAQKKEANVPKVIAVQSFRRGVGKSHITVNLAALLAMQGWRVGVVDTNFSSPSAHILLNLDDAHISHTLNDYLHGWCGIRETAHDLTHRLGATTSGRLYLVPASDHLLEMSRMLRQGYEVNLLTDGFIELADQMRLDVLLVDTYAGLGAETLHMMAFADTLAILLCPDQQDYQGTGVTVQIARQLEVPQTILVVNQVPPAFSAIEIRARIEKTYNCPVGAVLPVSEDLLALASAHLFVLSYPDHPITLALKQLAFRLVV